MSLRIPMSARLAPEPAGGAPASAPSASAASPSAPHAGAPPVVPRTHRRSRPLPAWRRAALWGVFAVATLLLAAINSDFLEKRIVLVNLAEILATGELVIFPKTAENVLTGWAVFAVVGLLFMYALRVASGGDFYDYLGSWWPGLLLVVYLFAAPIGELAAYDYPDDPETISFAEVGFDRTYAKLMFLLAGTLTIALLIRRFLLVCVARGVDLTYPKPYSRRLLQVMLLLGVVFTVTMTYVSYQRWNNFKIYATDTGLYDQMAYMFTQGKWWHVPLYTTNENRAADFADNWNAEHFMPTMILFWPLYEVWSHPFWLWFVQHLLLAGAAVLLYLLAGRMTGSAGLAFAVAVSFLLNPQVLRGAIEDFHPDALVPFFFFAMMLAYQHRRFVWYGAAMALALGCKEDMGFYVFLLGLWMVVGQRDRKWGGATLVIGLAYYLVATKLIIMELRAGEELRVLDRYKWMHPENVPPSGMGELLRYFVMYPETWIDWTYNQLRWLVPIRLMIPLFFLALLRPSFFLVLGPLTAAHFFSDWREQSLLWRYHGVAVIPFYYYAGVMGLQVLLHGRAITASSERPDDVFPHPGPSSGARVRERDSRDEPRPGWWRPLWRGDGYHPIVLIRSSSQTALARGLAAGILILGVILYREFAEGPLGGMFDDKVMQRPAHYVGVEEAFALIPPDAVVVAQNKFAPHFTHTHTTYLLPDIPDRPDATHVIFDVQGHQWPVPELGGEFREYITGLLTSGEWGALHARSFGGIGVLERGADTSLNAALLEDLQQYDWVYHRDQVKRQN